jgi:UDP-glucose 4-epimerase
MKIKKILITGGLGFIGSKLAKKLVDQNFIITIIDDKSTGKLSNLKNLYRKKIKIYNDSILNEKLIKKLIYKNDYIFHLAASVGVKYILENPIKSLNTNLVGSELVLKYCSIFKKKVLIASSSEVYGLNNKKEFSEKDIHTIGNSSIFRWSYSASKLVDEFYANAYKIEKNLQVSIIRFFNTVGPGQTGAYGMVIPRFIESAISNKNIEIYGNGNQNRTFLHVDDATDALIKIMTKNKFDTYNLGGKENIKIKNLAKKIIKLTKSKSKLKFISYKRAYNLPRKYKNNYQDIINRHPSIKKIKKDINFFPKKNLDTIIIDVIKDIKI